MAYRRRPVRRTRRRVARRTVRPRRTMRARTRYARPVRRTRRRMRVGGRFGRNRTFRKRNATYVGTRDGGLIVHNTEYIGQLVSGVASVNSMSPFTAQQYQLNPAASWLSWLNAIASNFESYRFIRFKLIFKSTSANALNSTNGSLGSCGLCAFHNAGQGTIVPTSKIQCEAMQGSVSGTPSRSHVLHINLGGRKSNVLSNLFVGNPNGAPNGSDQRFFNVCDLYAWSQGLQTTVPSDLGELFVSYTISLHHPRVFSGQFAYNNLTSKYEFVSNVASIQLSTGSTLLSGNNLFSAPTITKTADLYPTFGAPTLMTANSNNMQTLSFATDGTKSAFQFSPGTPSGQTVSPTNSTTTLFGNYLLSYRYYGWNTWTDAAANVIINTSTTQTAATPLISRGVSFPNLFAGGQSPFLSSGTIGNASTIGLSTIVLAFNVNTTSNVPATVALDASANIISTSAHYVDFSLLPFNGFVNSFA